MIHFHCTHCGQKIRVQALHAGRKGKCPKCKNIILVPQPTPEIPNGSSIASPSRTLNIPTPASSEPTPHKTAERKHAALFTRFCAYLVDRFLFFAVCFGVSILLPLLARLTGGIPRIAAQILSLVLLLAFFCLYFPLMESSSKQATLGKMWVDIVVTDTNGERLPFLTALARSLLRELLLLPGFILILFTKRKQALHDLIVKSLVVYKR